MTGFVVSSVNGCVNTEEHEENVLPLIGNSLGYKVDKLNQLSNLALSLSFCCLEEDILD
jgi:hypothetical protein